MIESIQALWQKGSPGRIFISYRHDDSQWVAGRLADSLSRYFGGKRVFRDIDGISGGADFGEVIHGTLGKADAVIVLIGDDWLSAADEAGNRRLDDPKDWVAQEIAAALETDIPVYPVLVDGTSMPTADALPENLRSLARFNAVTVSDNRWDDDVARQAKIVSLDIPSAGERKLQAVNLLISLGLLLTVLFSCTVLCWNLVCLIAEHAALPDWLSGICPETSDASSSGYSTEWPLSLAESGIPFLAIVPSSVLLFVFAHLIEESRRPFFLAAAWTGALGASLFFVLLKPIAESYEPISIFFGGTVTALLMFTLMNLSGFRPK